MELWTKEKMKKKKKRKKNGEKEEGIPKIES